MRSWGRDGFDVLIQVNAVPDYYGMFVIRPAGFVAKIGRLPCGRSKRGSKLLVFAALSGRGDERGGGSTLDARKISFSAGDKATRFAGHKALGGDGLSDIDLVKSALLGSAPSLRSRYQCSARSFNRGL